jgi:hypothetical protein
MRTRTLLLLSLGCAIAILGAGGALFWQLGTSDRGAAALALGASATLGDVTVVARDYTDDGQRALVTVTVGGVDDVDGLDGFRLVGGGVAAPVAADDAATTCAGVTEAEVTCTLAFDIAAAAAGERRLVFTRADRTVRWIVATGT